MINDANQYIDCPFCHAHTQTAITTSGSDKQMYVIAAGFDYTPCRKPS